MATWHSPDALVYYQKNFLLLPRCFIFSFNKVQTRRHPGADIDNDHELVLTTMKLKVRRLSNILKFAFDSEKRQDPNIEEVFNATVGGKFAALN